MNIFFRKFLTITCHYNSIVHNLYSKVWMTITQTSCDCDFVINEVIRSDEFIEVTLFNVCTVHHLILLNVFLVVVRHSIVAHCHCQPINLIHFMDLWSPAHTSPPHLTTWNISCFDSVYVDVFTNRYWRLDDNHDDRYNLATMFSLS